MLILSLVSDLRRFVQVPELVDYITYIYIYIYEDCKYEIELWLLLYPRTARHVHAHEAVVQGGGPVGLTIQKSCHV